jgi:N-acetylmuramoyl-L-alanine amidase
MNFGIAPEAHDIDVLARTLYGEARGEARPGRVAIACTVMNRVDRAATFGGYWWGDTVAEVCKKPWQFSCWNQGDPNRDVIEGVVAEGNGLFAECIEIATQAVRLELCDVTFGACHYHSKWVMPSWSADHAPVVTIGGHHFFNDIT